MKDVPSWVNVTGEIKFITLEYGYYEDRWWMLRYAALDGIGSMGSWLGIPIKFERIYSDYKFASGDTTRITLQSGKQLTLLELKITPRRADWRLMSGSLWFDDATAGLVRAVFRPARAFDLRRDADKGDMKDVPSWVNVTGEIKFITLEY